MDDEIYLSDLFAPLLPKWKLLAVFALIGGAIGLISAIVSPRVYKSTATIFIQPSSALSSLRASLPIPIGPTGGSAVGYYTKLLTSETLRRNTIARTGLLRDPVFMEAAKKERGEGILAAIRAFEKMVSVKDDKSGAVDIVVKSANPNLSARIANGMLDSLSKMVVTSSTRKVDFISRKLDETTKALEKAEDKLLAFQKRTGLVEMDEEGKRLLEQLSRLDAQVLTLNVDLIQTTSTLKNAGDLDVLVEQEIRRRGLESGLDYLSQKRAEAVAALERLPDIASSYIKLQRDVTVLSKIFEILTERYQLAKIEQQGEGGDYQVIDRARPSDVPESRGAAVKTVIGGFAGLLVASVLVIAAASKRRK